MKIIILLALVSILSIAVVQAQPFVPIDHSFSYQGELIDNGNLANGIYDFKVQMVDSNGFDIGTVSGHENTQVTNGLFNLDVKIGGISYFSGDQDYFFEISIRPGASGGPFTVLTDVQALQAVPLATNLTSNNATTGQVLTFNGVDWAPATSASSPWTLSGSEISYTSGFVGIGTTTPFDALHVKAPFDSTATFEGGQDMYVSFNENSNYRGYIGSYVSNATSTVGPVNDEDFEIGTYNGNNVGSVHITIQNDPALTVNNAKDVSIGTTEPISATHRLNIKADADDKALRLMGNQGTFEHGAKLNFGDGDYVQISEDTDDHLRVYGASGVTIQSDDNLRIDGASGVTIQSNISGTANMKPYVYGQIDSGATINSNRSSDGFSVTKVATGHYTINFNDNSIGTNFVINVTTHSSSPKFASAVAGANLANVYIWTASGVASDHAFQFVVYRK